MDFKGLTDIILTEAKKWVGAAFLAVVPGTMYIGAAQAGKRDAAKMTAQCEGPATYCWIGTAKGSLYTIVTLPAVYEILDKTLTPEAALVIAGTLSSGNGLWIWLTYKISNAIASKKLIENSAGLSNA